MAGCAALTTVGCSTSAVSAWRCQRSRRTASETSVLSRAGTGGLLFAYMGQDKDDPPPLPNYAPLVERTGQWQIVPVRHAEYNWFNFFENSADPAHVCILRYLGRTQRPKRFSKHGRDQPTNNGASTNAQCQGAVRLINSDADRTRKGSG